MEFLARWLWCTGKQSCEKWSGDHISTYQSRKEKRNMGQVPRSITFHARLLHIGMTPIRPYKEGYTMGIDTPWAWTQSQESVFTALQHALTSSLVLILLYYNKPFTLITDTSNYAMGSILEQDDMLGWLHPVAFYSKSLQPAERHYKIYDKELLAIIHTLKHFCHYLQGNAHQTKIFSDHTNLKYFTTKQTLTYCQAQWSLFLSTFNYIIIPKPGKINKSDALSRHPDYKAGIASKNAETILLLPEKFLLKPEQFHI